MKHKFIRASAVLLALVLLMGALPTALAAENDWFDPSHWGDDWWGYPGYSDTITVRHHHRTGPAALRLYDLGSGHHHGGDQRRPPRQHQ